MLVRTNLFYEFFFQYASVLTGFCITVFNFPFLEIFILGVVLCGEGVVENII